ncbi:hypothetical protein ACS8Y6_09790 [Salinisphaera sp. RV14]|uniref:hypothetical protein n=1 Tax=Salinisphaera sp. RV14 TaxID=3454140 RepID=UPI003F87EDCF
MLALVRAHPARAPLLSVCTRALIPVGAGLLEGRPNYASLDRLAGDEAVQVVEQRDVRDENIGIWAGISAGMHMTPAYIAATAGADTTGRAQRRAESCPDGIRHGDPAIDADMPAYIHATWR